MKKAVFTIGLILTGGLIFFLVQDLLCPKYMEKNVEGALISEYYENAGGNDIIFIGDCEVYSSFSPVKLYEETGLTSYIRGSANQTIWQSYYILEETYTYECPKVVVLNVLSMKYNEPENEAYNRLTIDGMRWSKSKYECIKASMTEEESMLSYIFPVIRFHSRYDELSKEDFKYLFDKKDISFNGYIKNTDIKPHEALPSVIPLTDYEFDSLCYDYLDRIRKLCEEHGSELILVKAPTLYPYWYEEWEEQIIDYADRYNLKYYNFMKLNDEIQIDYATDTYDGGLHLNVYGAEKLTHAFSSILTEDVGLSAEAKADNVTERFEKLKERYHEK